MTPPPDTPEEADRADSQDATSPKAGSSQVDALRSKSERPLTTFKFIATSVSRLQVFLQITTTSRKWYDVVYGQVVKFGNREQADTASNRVMLKKQHLVPQGVLPGSTVPLRKNGCFGHIANLLGRFGSYVTSQGFTLLLITDRPFLPLLPTEHSNSIALKRENPTSSGRASQASCRLAMTLSVCNPRTCYNSDNITFRQATKGVTT